MSCGPENCVMLRGRNPAISSTASTLWVMGATNYAQLTSGAAFEIVSSSANDAAAGTGARTVEVTGVTGAYAVFKETITMNGVTPVPLVNTSVIGINSLKVLTAGSGTVNAGTIDARVVSGGVVKSRINTAADAGLGLGQAADFIYTVPANMKALLKDVHFSGITLTGALTVNIRTYNSSGVKLDQGSGRSSLYVTGFNGGVGFIHFGDGLWIPEKTLIEGRVVVSAGTSDVVAQANLFIFDA